MEFRELRDEELDAAYQIICEAVEWLEGKGIEQWVRPLPRPWYERRHADGQNFGLFTEGELVAVLSIVTLDSTVWAQHVPQERSTWVATAATARLHHGKGLGKLALTMAIDCVAGRGEKALYLDCLHGTGFLQRYYESLGFERIARATHTYRLGEFDMVLMRKEL